MSPLTSESLNESHFSGHCRLPTKDPFSFSIFNNTYILSAVSQNSPHADTLKRNQVSCATPWMSLGSFIPIAHSCIPAMGIKQMNMYPKHADHHRFQNTSLKILGQCFFFQTLLSTSCKSQNSSLPPSYQSRERAELMTSERNRVKAVNVLYLSSALHVNFQLHHPINSVLRYFHYLLIGTSISNLYMYIYIYTYTHT